MLESHMVKFTRAIEATNPRANPTTLAQKGQRLDGRAPASWMDG